jgi:hypothetical protein
MIALVSALMILLTFTVYSQPNLTEQEQIASAMSAAPAAIAENATILSWHTHEGGEPVVLREGTNGWVCYPTSPTEFGEAAGEDPMCLDEMWQEWVRALVERDEPQLESVGIAYMLQGDKGSSNIDPYATGPTPDNEWVQTGPHIMVIVPDVAQLEGLPTDPHDGGPYVMWRDTPLAHIMVPVE